MMSEDRLRKVEQGVANLHADFRVMSSTLKSIDNTLISFKEVTNKITDIQIKLAETTTIAIDAQSKSNKLFTKYDELNSKLVHLHEADTMQNLKIGGAERFMWLLITIVVGFIVAKVKLQ